MTSYGLHPLLIIAISFILASFNLHLPWTSTISPHNSVCYNLHLSWTIRRRKADYIWISTSQGPPYYGKKVIYIESTPPTTSSGFLRLLIIRAGHFLINFTNTSSSTEKKELGLYLISKPNRKKCHIMLQNTKEEMAFSVFLIFSYQNHVKDYFWLHISNCLIETLNLIPILPYFYDILWLS